MSDATMTTIRDLDRAVANVLALRGDLAAGFWRLGDAIRAIHDADLWTLRTDEGRARYARFGVFVVEELRMSRSQAYALIEVARTYTEEQARRLGSTRCALILRAAPEDRDAIVAAAETKTTREVAAEAQHSREARGYRRPGHHAAAGAKGRKRQMSERSDIASRPPRTAGVSLVLPEETVTAQLWQRKKRKLRATRIGDEPCARIDTLVEGVVIDVAVVQSSSGLVLRLRASRSEGS